jgi:hypothetical protein
MNNQVMYYPPHRARWGPTVGLLFAVILTVSFFVVMTPDTTKSPQYILNWYTRSSHKTQLHISVVLSDIAVVLGIFWFGYLRDRFGRTDVGARFAPILLAGAIIFATGGLIFNGAYFALTDAPTHMTTSTAQTLNFLQSDLGAAALVVGISIFMWADRLLRLLGYRDLDSHRGLHDVALRGESAHFRRRDWRGSSHRYRHSTLS